MPKICMVTGSFSQGGRPVQGWVRFTPSRLWVSDEGQYWACLAPTVQLEVGGFTALLTPTDTDQVPWHYLVETPAGNFRIVVSQSGNSYDLRKLVQNPPTP